MPADRTILHCVLTLLALAGALPAASVERIDGPALDGDLTWKPAAVVVGGAEIALADCARILPGLATAPETGLLGVWLTDGGWLPVSAITAPEADRVSLATPFGGIELPLARLAGWGLELPAGDAKRDAVLLASGLVEGRIEGVSAEHLLLRTDLDPEPLRLPLAEVLACRLAAAKRPPKGVHLSAPWRDDRPSTLLVPTATGLTLAGVPIPGDRLPPLLVEGGRMVALSALTPAAVDERGAFGTVWPWQRDTGLDGDPLQTGGKRFRRGIAVHSEARLAWKLDAAFERLRATVGISDLVAPEGDCLVRLVADGSEIWKARLTGRTQPSTLDLPLTGVRELVLQIDLGERYDIGDHVVFGDARLTAAKR